MVRLITLDEVVGDFKLFGYTHEQIVSMIKFAKEHGWKPKEEKQDGRSSE